MRWTQSSTWANRHAAARQGLLAGVAVDQVHVAGSLANSPTSAGANPRGNPQARGAPWRKCGARGVNCRYLSTGPKMVASPKGAVRTFDASFSFPDFSGTPGSVRNATTFSGSAAPDACVRRPSRPRHVPGNGGGTKTICLMHPKMRHTDAPVAAEQVFGRPVQVQVEFAAGRAPYGDTTSFPGGMAAWTRAVLLSPNRLVSPAIRGHGRRMAFWLPSWESTVRTVGAARGPCKRLWSNGEFASLSTDSTFLSVPGSGVDTPSNKPRQSSSKSSLCMEFI
jgi:hypothetical protein